VRNGKRSTWTEVLLNIDDKECGALWQGLNHRLHKWKSM
jgi:hypothetical protein